MDASTIGKYRVMQRLGEGATSEVFLCRDDFHDREVAIKRVRASALGDAVDICTPHKTEFCAVIRDACRACSP